MKDLKSKLIKYLKENKNDAPGFLLDALNSSGVSITVSYEDESLMQENAKIADAYQSCEDGSVILSVTVSNPLEF